MLEYKAKSKSFEVVKVRKFLNSMDFRLNVFDKFFNYRPFYQESIGKNFEFLFREKSIDCDDWWKCNAVLRILFCLKVKVIQRTWIKTKKDAICCWFRHIFKNAICKFTSLITLLLRGNTLINFRLLQREIYKKLKIKKK